MSSQLLQDNVVRSNVKGLTKAQVNNIHGLSFILYTGYDVCEGIQDWGDNLNGPDDTGDEKRLWNYQDLMHGRLLATM